MPGCSAPDRMSGGGHVTAAPTLDRTRLLSGWAAIGFGRGSGQGRERGSPVEGSMTTRTRTARRRPATPIAQRRYVTFLTSSAARSVEQRQLKKCSLNYR